jgi:hypothetical protein
MATTQVVRCGKCGRILDESPSLDPSNREPCSECGSVVRKVDLGLTASVNVVGRLGLEIRKSWYERSLPWLLALACLTIVSGLIGGLVLHGWPSVGASVGFSLITFFVGLKAMTHVRSVDRRQAS